MLRQRLQQKLIQKLSPQQIQLIKLLELPAVQLEQRIKEELIDNPVLEEGSSEEKDEYDKAEAAADDSKDLSIDEYLADNDSTPAYKLNPKNYSKDDNSKNDFVFSSGKSFNELMLDQLSLRTLPARQRRLAEYIIGNIDDDGYLRRDLEALVDDLMFNYGEDYGINEIEQALAVVQEFDPPGVAARNLRECLLIQLSQKPASTAINIAKTIITNHFVEFSKKHFTKIMARLNIEEDLLKQAIEEILRLNPKPGGGVQADKAAEHIVPDFILENKDGELVISLNSRNIPELRVSRMYSEMLEAYSKNKKDKQNREAATFVKQKLDSAKWFIDAIKQRQTTLMLTMQTIAELQKEYFLSGGDETTLTPMILKDVADKTKLDISTISRVASSKYVQTPFAILPLKFFFSEGMLTDRGEEVSTHEIRRILQDLIEEEDKRNPLTDEELSLFLQERGYQIARRTVAKYREHLNIPVARLRREL